MSDLQLGLAVLGALVLVALGLHGAWQARKWSVQRTGLAAPG